jgi:3-hydroxybutyryl-CoA dehydratase
MTRQEYDFPTRRQLGRITLLDKYFDKLAVGDVFAGTRGRTITETDIALFSAVSGDWSPLHNDAAFAAEGPFGSRIAHGLLLVSMMTGLAPISARAVIALYGFDRIRFVKPVLLGDTITYTSRVSALEPKGDGRGVADLEFQVCNQHQNVCVAGTIKLLLHKSPGS